MGLMIRIGLLLVLSLSVTNGDWDLSSLVQSLVQQDRGESRGSSSNYSPLISQLNSKQDRGESRGSSNYLPLISQLLSKSRLQNLYNEDDDNQRQYRIKKERNSYNDQRLHSQYHNLVNLLGSLNDQHDHDSRIHSVVHEDLNLVPTNKNSRYRSSEAERVSQHEDKYQDSSDRYNDRHQWQKESNRNKEMKILVSIFDLLSRKPVNQDDRNDQRDRQGVSNNRYQKLYIGRANDQPQQSPVIKTLLRIESSLRCGAQNECKVECEQKPKCKKKCEKKFVCPDPCATGTCESDYP
ncbi:hypothetical protein O0L34_g10343 [Tuta absoluta]|nr:hypothetical protein O0L34_g10343 [Tuta absoluta]